MAGRLSTAGIGVVAAALWASAAVAATPGQPETQTPAMKLATRDNSATGSAPLVNLNLGSAMPLGTTALQAQRGEATAPLQLVTGRERNLEIFGSLFPGTAGLRSTFLMGSSTTVASSFAIGGGLSLGLGHSALALNDFQPDALTRNLSARLGPERHTTGTTSANLNWNFNDWADLGLTASQGRGNGALLGAAPGSLAASSVLNSSALGISARVGFGEGWVTSLSYSEGV